MIPIRHNEAAVLRYEKTIRQVCTSWPQPVLVDPSPLSIETFRCRFRDAMVGVLKYNQGPPELKPMLMKLDEKVVCSESLGLLKIGPASKSRVPKAATPGLLVSGIVSVADNEAPLDSPDRDVIRAITLLTSIGFLSGARVTGVTEEFIYSCFDEDYEGGVLVNADNTYTIY